MFLLSIHGPGFHTQRTIRAAKTTLGRLSDGGDLDADFVEVPDPFLAPRQLQLDFLLLEKRVALKNFGRSIVLSDGRRILRHQELKLDLPSRISIGQSVIELNPLRQDFPIDQALTDFVFATDENQKDIRAKRAPSISKLGLWFEAIADFQETPAGTTEFLLEAAKCAFDPGGLDSAMVLQPDSEGDWQIAASYVPSPELGISFRPTIVDRVLQTSKTVFHDAARMDIAESSNDADFVVATPVFDETENIVAILYAMRSMKRANNRIGIRTLEAQFIHMIGQSLSAGLRRLESESRAAQNRALLEQAFSPEVSRRLLQDPKILEPCEQQVSILFADLRGFTSLADDLPTDLTFQLLAEVMDRFTEIVIHQHGVILDYFGDGLAAFWNAPIKIPDHAQLACRCGLLLLDEMESINRAWARRLGRRLSIGIGIHTGQSQVGNSGSQKRLKYGPRGAAVNLAQRVETATKHLGLPILVSQSVAENVVEPLAARRVCHTTLPGISQPVGLYSPFNPNGISSDQTQDLELYASALKAFEARDFHAALDILTQLESRNCNDPAAEFLLKALAKIQKQGRSETTVEFQVEPYQPLLLSQQVEFPGREDSDDQQTSPPATESNPPKQSTIHDWSI